MVCSVDPGVVARPIIKSVVVGRPFCRILTRNSVPIVKEFMVPTDTSKVVIEGSVAFEPALVEAQAVIARTNRPVSKIKTRVIRFINACPITFKSTNRDVIP